jgi:hypothetical protein
MRPLQDSFPGPLTSGEGRDRQFVCQCLSAVIFRIHRSSVSGFKGRVSPAAEHCLAQAAPSRENFPLNSAVPQMTSTPSVPALSAEPLPACGFKEWSMVCDALAAGEQSIILRKGGIHEGRAGFFWKHDRFFLFPTRFHEQDVQFPWPGSSAPAAAEDEPHVITLFATVSFKYQLTSWEAVEELRPFHFWTTETIRERFDYTDDAGISLAFLRVWRARAPWVFPHQARFGGCRSWLDLPDVPREMTLSPVLTDAEHEARLADVRKALSLF